jgi:hypothetical protein
MTAVRLGWIESTNAQTLTDTAQSWQADNSAPDRKFAYVVTATVAGHIKRTEGNAGSAQDATISDCYIAANVPYVFYLVAGDWISFVRDGGTSGEIYFTSVDH